MTAAWEELVALAEGELALLRAGRVDELPAALAERAHLASRLAPAPAEAGPVLVRLRVVQDQLVSELARAREDTGRELSTLVRGGNALRGYRSAAGPAVARVHGTA